MELLIILTVGILIIPTVGIIEGTIAFIKEKLGRY